MQHRRFINSEAVDKINADLDREAKFVILSGDKLKEFRKNLNIKNRMTRYCFTLDLKNDPALISEYEKYHQEVWPEILESISKSGIKHMEIYRWENRLFMIMDVGEEFSFELKNKMDATNPKVQEWEQLMWKYQQGLPGAKVGEKWQLMKNIFNL